MLMKNKALIAVLILVIIVFIASIAVTQTSIVKQTNITPNQDKLNQGSELTVTLTDEDGKPLANKDVQILIVGVTYNRTTDSNGEAKLNINLLPGDYGLILTFDGDLFYKASTSVNSLKVLNNTLN